MQKIFCCLLRVNHKSKMWKKNETEIEERTEKEECWIDEGFVLMLAFTEIMG